MTMEFDIRQLVPGSELDEPRIQAVYDTVNRMVALIGDIPFSELFGAPLRTIARSAGPRVEPAENAGLLQDSGGLARLARQLGQHAGEATIGELFCASRTEVPARLVELLIKLRRFGMQIPMPAFNDGKSDQRRKALDRLLEVAPDLTFKELFTRAKADTSKNTVAAIARLRTLGRLAGFANDRCCIHKVGPDSITDKCDFQSDKWCNLTGADGETCSIGSQACEPA